MSESQQIVPEKALRFWYLRSWRALDGADEVRREEIWIRPMDVVSVSPTTRVWSTYYGRLEETGCDVRFKSGGWIFLVGDSSEIRTRLGFGDAESGEP